MRTTFAQVAAVPESQFQMFVSYSPPTFLAAAFWIATTLLLIGFVLQFLLHAFFRRRAAGVLPSVVLKIAVLYVVASMVVALDVGQVVYRDIMARGGTPDPTLTLQGIHEVLHFIWLGVIGLFLGLFDDFVFGSR